MKRDAEKKAIKPILASQLRKMLQSKPPTLVRRSIANHRSSLRTIEINPDDDNAPKCINSPCGTFSTIQERSGTRNRKRRFTSRKRPISVFEKNKQNKKTIEGGTLSKSVLDRRSFSSQRKTLDLSEPQKSRCKKGRLDDLNGYF